MFGIHWKCYSQLGGMHLTRVLSLHVIFKMTNASTLWVYPSVQLSKQTSLLVYLMDSGSKKKLTEISYTSTYKERQSLCKIRATIMAFRGMNPDEPEFKIS